MAPTLTPKQLRTETTFSIDVGPLLADRVGAQYTTDARYPGWLAEYLRGQAPYQIVAHVPKQKSREEADASTMGAAVTRGW